MSCCDLQRFGTRKQAAGKGCTKGDRNLRGQPNGGIGQWTAADYDTLGPSCLGIQTSGHQHGPMRFDRPAKPGDLPLS